jgi:hypothetical protein
MKEMVGNGFGMVWNGLSRCNQPETITERVPPFNLHKVLFKIFYFHYYTFTIIQAVGIKYTLEPSISLYKKTLMG